MKFVLKSIANRYTREVGLYQHRARLSCNYQNNYYGDQICVFEKQLGNPITTNQPLKKIGE